MNYSVPTDKDAAAAIPGAIGMSLLPNLDLVEDAKMVAELPVNQVYIVKLSDLRPTLSTQKQLPQIVAKFAVHPVSKPVQQNMYKALYDYMGMPLPIDDEATVQIKIGAIQTLLDAFLVERGAFQACLNPENHEAADFSSLFEADQRGLMPEYFAEVKLTKVRSFTNMEYFKVGTHFEVTPAQLRSDANVTQPAAEQAAQAPQAVPQAR